MVVWVTQRTGDAGVVDQHVEVPGGRLDGVGGVTDRLVGGHVQFEEVRANGLDGGLSTLAAAGGEIHAVPGLDQTPGRLQPDTPIGAGDQHDGCAHRCRAHLRLLPADRISTLTPGRPGNVAQSGPPS
ncbi:hypothetical protein GCM10009753_52700 [Streptantibioticus ferralitis]